MILIFIHKLRLHSRVLKIILLFILKIILLIKLVTFIKFIINLLFKLIVYIKILSLVFIVKISQIICLFFQKTSLFLPNSNIIGLILKFHHVIQFIRIIKFIHIFIFSSSFFSFFFLVLLLVFKVNCIIRLSNLFHLTLFLIFITSFLLHNLTISCAPLVNFFRSYQSISSSLRVFLS